MSSSRKEKRRKTQKPKSEALKKRRFRQRKERRARTSAQKREQRQMLRQIAIATGDVPEECTFCFDTAHDTEDCPDQGIIKARQVRLHERRMKQQTPSSQANPPQELLVHEDIVTIIAPILPPNTPVNQHTLTDAYICMLDRQMRKDLPENEKAIWNRKIQAAIRKAAKIGLIGTFLQCLSKFLIT